MGLYLEGLEPDDKYLQLRGVGAVDLVTPLFLEPAVNGLVAVLVVINPPGYAATSGWEAAVVMHSSAEVDRWVRGMDGRANRWVMIGADAASEFEPSPRIAWDRLVRGDLPAWT